MRTLTYVKTAFASILLTSSAAVWASAPTKFVTNSSNTASFTSPIAVTTTTPEASGHPAYVVAAAADQNQDLEVIAWHDQTLVQAPTTRAASSLRALVIRNLPSLPGA